MQFESTSTRPVISIMRVAHCTPTYRSSLLQMIEKAGESGELTPLLLLVIRNRLELARQDVRCFVSFPELVLQWSS